MSDVPVLLLILAYLGGVLTIISPCILSVLPFVFARADRPFRRNGLPLLAGMAVTFVAVATLAAFGGEWAASTNQYGRDIALVVLAILGVTLLSRRLATWLARPAVALGNRLTRRTAGREDSVAGSVGLGVATGLLWAPCAGPILGLILAGAAINGASVRTTLLLLAYALGAVSSLAVAVLAGGRVFAWMKRALGAGEWVRRGLGVLVLAGVVTIALGLDTGLLARVSLASTAGIEQHLVKAVRPAEAAPVRHSIGAPANAANPHTAGSSQALVAPLPVLGRMPLFGGATHWFNSPALTPAKLRGKVVLVDFWTYSCINCIRTLPYVNAWYRKYKDHGLVIVGVHTPEFAFEKNPHNVQAAIQRFDIHYPVAMDNRYAIWRAFDNEYWPADYFVDGLGRVRATHFGEGDYRHDEDIIRELLTEAGYSHLPGGYVHPQGRGAEAAAPVDRRSPETYVGYARAEHFDGGSLVPDRAHDYHASADLAVNHWTLNGRWNVHAHEATLVSTHGSITYHFRGRDLHLVLGPGSGGKPVRFRVTIDGAAPGANHGSDIDAKGYGVITGQRLYQLVHQAHGTGEQTVTITFLQPDVQVYSFTFG
ncbi:MAG TPA: cytochrome c biogenesis protein DipZ [Rhodanobacteraceae bacterium]